MAGDESPTLIERVKTWIFGPRHLEVDIEDYDYIQIEHNGARLRISEHDETHLEFDYLDAERSNSFASEKLGSEVREFDN